jgi:flagellar operon protein
MTNRIQVNGIGPVRPPEPQKPAAAAGARPAPGFDQALAQAMARPVKFSAHAQERLTRRQLSPSEMLELSKAVDRAEEKGARESLVLLRDLALVVSIKNRTVITAVEGSRMKENIFTNIDSAVIL